MSDTQQDDLLRQVAQADTHKSLIVTSGGSSIRRLFLLIPDLDARGAVHWLGAELDAAYLWNTTGAGERPERICVLGPDDLPVYCNHHDPKAWLAEIDDLMRTRARPQSLQLSSGEKILTAAWSLYLRPHYQFERWTILAGVPQAMALVSIRAFDRIFAAVAVLALVLAYFLGTRMIRGNLQPLQTLRSATRELAEGQFAHRVRLNSGDEFQDLGEAFNAMASRIGSQFDELGTLAGLDRALQAALSPAEAVAAGASALIALVGPGRCAVYCHERWETENAFWYTKLSTAVVSQGPVELTRGLGDAQLSGTRESLLPERPYLQSLRVSDDRMLQLMPVVNKRHLKAEILLLEPRSDDMAAVTRVRDVLATTLNKLVLDQRLRYQAGHDWLTGLPNRRLMNDLFDQWAKHALKRRAAIGMLELNLDRFKQVNDAHGHAQGDQLLSAVGQRLSKVLPDDVVLSRFGSDEFVMMLRADDHHQLMAQITMLGQRINDELDRPLRLAHREVRLSASMGAAIFPRHGDCFQVMLQNTDAALRAAKETRRGSLLMFSSGMRDALVSRMDIEQALKGALQNDELLLHYQPVVDSQTGVTTGAEALMRWQRPGIGLVRPDRFMDVAEDSGLIVGFGAGAIKEACERLKGWHAMGHSIETVAINVSGAQIADPGFEESVHKALADSGLEPHHLILEVTENALIGCFDESARLLTRLRELGVKVMIDDFGTGYASFKSMKLLPVDGLKIDRLFVKDLPDSPRDAAIVAAVVSLAQSSGLKLVAGGVQTEAQSEFLRKVGVSSFQGYLFDRGLPAREFEQRLSREQQGRVVDVKTA